MNELTEFKEALQADIKSLTKLQMATLSAKDFYRPLIHLFIKAWFCYALINTAILILIPHQQSFLARMGENIFSQGLITILPMFFISDYVIFRNLIKTPLQSSVYFNQYLRIWIRLYFALYALLFFIFRLWFVDSIIGNQFASTGVSVVLSGFALNFELQRLGLSTLLETLSHVISKAKKAADPIQYEE